MKFSNHVSTYKAAVIFIVAVIVLAAVTVPLLAFYHQSLLEKKQAKLRTMVNYVYEITEKYYKKTEKAGMSKDDAIKDTFQTIQLLPYDDNGYVWINDMNGIMVFHPVIPDLVGKDMYNVKDSNGKLIIHEFIQTVTLHNEGFVDYMWPKPNIPRDQTFRKLSFVRKFEPWGWIIGSGVYIDDVDNDFRHAVLVTGGLAFMILVFLAILIVTLSESIKKP